MLKFMYTCIKISENVFVVYLQERRGWLPWWNGWWWWWVHEQLLRTLLILRILPMIMADPIMHHKMCLLVGYFNHCHFFSFLVLLYYL